MSKQEEARFTYPEQSAFSDSIKTENLKKITDPERIETNLRRREDLMKRYGLTPEELEEFEKQLQK